MTTIEPEGLKPGGTHQILTDVRKLHQHFTFLWEMINMTKIWRSISKLREIGLGTWTTQHVEEYSIHRINSPHCQILTQHLSSSPHSGK